MNPYIERKLKEQRDADFTVHLSLDQFHKAQAFLTSALEEALSLGRQEGAREEAIYCYDHREAARRVGIKEGIELAEGVVKKGDGNGLYHCAECRNILLSRLAALKTPHYEQGGLKDDMEA